MVTILDANDNVPEFEQPNYEIGIPTSALIDDLPVWVGKVGARDADSGRNALIHYTIVGGIGGEIDAIFWDEFLQIDPKTGDIFMKVS